jgi:hypothetical protein
LVVWAINAERLELDEPNDQIRCDLSLVTVPNSSNSFLHAQQGLFTFYHPLGAQGEDLGDEALLDKPLDVVLSERRQFSTEYVLRITLPWTEAGKVLKLLAREGIDAASVFPGYGGAVQSVLEKRYWR